MIPRRHTLPVPNADKNGTHDLVFYDYGDINALRTVICVHGLTRNAHDFDLLAEALCREGRRVFTLNMAGRGESQWLANPMGYTYPSYVADCLAMMDNFHLRGVEWVGTSMGGILGMMIVANAPGRIRKLVLNDIGIHLSSDALSRIYSYVSTMPTSFVSRAEASAYLAEIFSAFGITDPTQWETFVTNSLLPTTDGSIRYACDPAIAVPLRAATDNFTDTREVNLTELWDKIDIPTFILRGSNSDILSADTVRAMRLTHPRAETVTIEGVGHAPALMSDDQIRLVVGWLTGNNTVMRASGL